MNLELDPAQHQLIEAIAKSDAAEPPQASGWDVFDAIGLSALLAPEPGARPLLGTLEWCLVLEELGAGLRSHMLVRSVHAFLDVYVAQARDGAAAEAFRTWAGAQGAAPRADEPLLLQQADGVWRFVDPRPPALTALPDEITLDASTAQAVHDRGLLLVAAYACGVARRCLASAQKRAGGRVVAGRRLLEHQGTAHRIARGAVDLTLARAGLWRAAQAEDEGERAGHRAPAAAAASVSAALDCAHTVVQVFGAAGTSAPQVVAMFRTACALPAVSGSPRALWAEAGARRVNNLA
ncbi:acyl-CoA dehydrogenase family protein [Streptomyces sp. NPDC007905]|uniref:acyl-CoA dehydrogenase family protein n=1 Tax=Streptomyces sp. NPDC007905 TaxID=3364788 RepID=UPI0036E08503